MLELLGRRILGCRVNFMQRMHSRILSGQYGLFGLFAVRQRTICCCGSGFVYKLCGGHLSAGIHGKQLLQLLTRHVFARDCHCLHRLRFRKLWCKHWPQQLLKLCCGLLFFGQCD